MHPPDGWFLNDLIVFNELDSRGYVSKGFEIQPPDLRNASNEHRIACRDALRRFLHSLDATIRVQFRWTVDSDYKDALLQYQSITERTTNRWVRHVRNERFNRYWQAMNQGVLRREKLQLYLSRKITVNPPTGLSAQQLAEHHERLLSQLNDQFQHFHRSLISLFESLGCRVIAMEDHGHFASFLNFFHPSCQLRENFEPSRLFNPDESIQSLCWNDGRQGATNFGFFGDGYYHNIVLLKRRPQKTFPGIIYHLTSLPFLNYSITLNIAPKNVRREIEQNEQALQRIISSYNKERRHSQLTAKEIKEATIRALSQGEVLPFSYEFIIHVWDESETTLISKTRQIEAAVNAMQDAQAWTTNISSAATTKNVWFNSWPGWMWGKYTAQNDSALDSWLADLIPFSSTFTGCLEDAEALYDGPHRNLIGVKTFASDTPQLGVLFGMTRAGKSGFMTDLLTQTEPYYDFTLIVEEGLSYGVWTQTQGCKPIIVQADGDLTINYFDTGGVPLTNLQISIAAALVAKMAGHPADEDRRNLRIAQITQYIDQLYSDTWTEWLSRNPSKHDEIARLALAVDTFQQRCLPAGSTILDAWSEFNHPISASQETHKAKILATITEREVSQFLQNPITEHLVRNIGLAFLTPQDFPTHDMLHQMMLVAPFAEHKKEDIHHLATLIAPWCSQRLVCGVSTISLNSRVAHFELGAIAESNRQLKEIAGFLIANYGRQHIVGLPRRVRKRVIFEEVARVLDIAGGEQLVAEFYAQLSKHSTWIISIVQQYARFKQSRIRPIVVGNAKQFFFTRMNDRRDVDDIAQDINLSETTKQAILQYPLPEHLPASNKYSSLTYFQLDAQQPVCGTLHNRLSKEMLYCSTSTGTEFDRRTAELLEHPDVVEGILHEANKTQPEKKP